MIGIGLERVIEDIWKDAMDGKPLLQRPWVPLSEKTRSMLHTLEKTNPRTYLFVTQVIKDIIGGTTYNGLAFFTRPMLESAKGEHMIASIGINAAEALGTKGLESQVLHREAMDEFLKLEKDRTTLQAEIADLAKQTTQEAKSRLQVDTEKLGELNTQIGAFVIPPEISIRWQRKLRKYLKYSNPATVLGISMIADAGVTVFEHLRQVQQVRKEKGGLPGKKVFMPKGDEHRGYGDRKPFRERREYEKKPYNKNVQYYGRGQWNRNMKDEEEAIEKLI